MNICIIYPTRLIQTNAMHSVARMQALIVREWSRRNDVKITVFHPNHKIPQEEYLGGVDYPIVNIPDFLLFMNRLLYKSKLSNKTNADIYIRFAFKNIMSKKIDVIFCTTLGFQIYLRKMGFKGKIFLWSHGLPGNNLSDQIKYYNNLQECDLVAVSSQAFYTKHWIDLQQDYVSPLYFQVNNPIDLNTFSTKSNLNKNQLYYKYNVDLDFTIIVFLGGKIKVKGWRLAYEAFLNAKLPKKTILINVGHGIDVEKTKYISNEKIIKEIPPIDPTVLNELLTIADVGIMPSVWFENFPLALHEFMASETFPIVGNTGGMPELINKTNGIIVNQPNNIIEWQQSIQKYFSLDINFIRSAIAKNRERIEKEHTPEKVAGIIFKQIVNCVENNQFIN